ncbi:MAG: glycosyltransferase family 92 protein [Butyrivibrio sp.]|nr:glycosyltransferase family 92 protein [Butyrivibrio sp.]
MKDLVSIPMHFVTCYNYGLFFRLKRLENRNLRIFNYILLSPIMLVNGILNFLYYNTIGIITSRYELKTFQKKTYKYDYGIVACVKNETPYIKEWLEYYRILGVKKFYIFDNESNDNFKEYIKDYIDKGIVDYTFFAGKGKQYDMYYEGLKKCRKDCKYVSFLDIDEFLMPVNKEESIVSIADYYWNKYDNMAALAVNWLIYGSAGHKTKPEGLVIENYLYRAKEDHDSNKCIKGICNPRLIKGYLTSSHFPITKNFMLKTVLQNGKKVTGPWVYYPDNSYEKLRVNHYFSKSENECREKFERGNASRLSNNKRKWEEYEIFNRNEVYDDSMLYYADEIKKRLSNNY